MIWLAWPTRVETLEAAASWVRRDNQAIAGDRKRTGRA
jgi:hypothetical protein